MKKQLKFFSALTLISLIFFTSCNKNEVTSLTLDTTTLNLTVGQTDSLIANISVTGDISKIPVVWNSSDKSIVSVNNGAIQGLSVGTATITVMAGEKTATCEVTVDDIYPILTKGELWYWGDVYNSTTSNNFTVCLASSGINMSDFSGNGEMLFLEINTDLSAKDSIPSGIYEMMPDLTTNYLLPNSIVPGYTDSQGYEWGTWYYGNTTNQVSQGNATIAYSNGIYKIDYALFDGYGAKISGSYEGALAYSDYSDTTSVSAVKSKILSRSFNPENKSLSLKRK